MKHILFSTGLLAFVYGLTPSIAFAGAWSTPQGETQIISTTIYSRANREFDDGGDLSVEASFQKVDTRFYLEYGLKPKISVIAATAFQDVDYVGRNGFERFTGFGETQLGFRYNIHTSKNWVLSGQAVGIIGGAGESIPDADLGNGGNGVELRALAGHSYVIGNKKGFVDVQAAWQFRGANVPNEWRLDGTIGIEPRERLKIIGQGFYRSAGESLFGVDRIRRNKSLKLSASAVYQASEKRSYQVGVFQTVWGENIVREKGLMASVWQQY